VAKIEVPELYEKGRPKLGGLSDPRLGTMDRTLKCTTDGMGQQDCPGYFGHIELAKPMFHVGFIKTVNKVLRCISYHNSRLLVEPVRRPDLLRCLAVWTVQSFRHQLWGDGSRELLKPEGFEAAPF
jgi:DNA-directed RNA polymerase II subunit RPB1